MTATALPTCWQDDDILFCVERSVDDAWVVVYRIRRKPSSGHVDWSDPIEVFWLDPTKSVSDPEAREELSWRDNLGYSIVVNDTDRSHKKLAVSLSGCKDITIKVQVFDDEAVAFCPIDEHMCLIQSVYLKVNSLTSMTNPLEYVDFFGEDKKGHQRRERIEPSGMVSNMLSGFTGQF